MTRLGLLLLVLLFNGACAVVGGGLGAVTCGALSGFSPGPTITCAVAGAVIGESLEQNTNAYAEESSIKNEEKQTETDDEKIKKEFISSLRQEELIFYGAMLNNIKHKAFIININDVESIKIKLSSFHVEICPSNGNVYALYNQRIIQDGKYMRFSQDTISGQCLTAIVTGNKKLVHLINMNTHDFLFPKGLLNLV
jgi:hypothetical protein